MRVVYRITHGGDVNVLGERMMELYREVFGIRASLNGTNVGQAYAPAKERLHRIGCAIDVDIPWGMSLKEMTERSRQLATRMYNEIDRRTRVVLFENHHLHLAVRCTLDYYREAYRYKPGVESRIKFRSRPDWDAWLWESRFAVE